VKQEKSSQQKAVYYDVGSKLKEHPIRRSLCFEFSAGMPVLRSDGKEAARSKTDNRLIYRIPIHLSDDTSDWSTLILRMISPDGERTYAFSETVLGKSGPSGSLIFLEKMHRSKHRQNFVDLSSVRAWAFSQTALRKSGPSGNRCLAQSAKKPRSAVS